MPLTLFHAFNWKFSKIKSALGEIAALGFDGLQISPAQKSFPIAESSEATAPAWYMRYQPYDYSKIHGLGDENDLTELCEEAKRLGLFVVADLVFNHMGAPFGQDKAKQLWRNLHSGGQSQLESRRFLDHFLASFPQFDAADFHDFKPIDGLQYDHDDHRFDGWGGAGTWPDLRPTPRVLQAQKEHISILHRCGVRGFRFDAVKQLYPESQYFPLARFCRSLDNVEFVYGEVLSTDPVMHKDYEIAGPTTNFQLMKVLVESFDTGSYVEWSRILSVESSHSVVFARNHDTVMQYLPSLSFENQERAALAVAFVISARSEPVLVFDADLYDETFSLLTREALFFRRHWSKQDPQKSQDSRPACREIRTHRGALLLESNWGDGMVFNASDAPLRLEGPLRDGDPLLSKMPSVKGLVVKPWTCAILSPLADPFQTT